MTAVELAVEIAGWLGATLILGAYLLLSIGKVTGRSPLYQGMNVAGAAGFIVNGWWHGALPSAVLNVIWMMIGGIAFVADMGEAGIIDLSHVIEDGMVTYQGLPGPHICDYWTREGSAANYDDGSSFQIGRIDMVANTGTYLDSPFHRFADGKDLAALPLESLAELPGIVVRRPHRGGIATDGADLAGLDVRGRAVLIHTGWDEHWRAAAYSVDHPFLTEAAAGWLVEQGAALVGIDSYNIDDTRVRARPVHTRLLGGEIPICEHMRGLEQLPDRGFRSAVPPKIAGMGTFPVRAFAVLG